MKIVKGWRRIDNQRGYVNDTTGQNLIVAKTEFGEHYFVMLFPLVKNNDAEGKRFHQSMRPNQKQKHLLWIG